MRLMLLHTADGGPNGEPGFLLNPMEILGVWPDVKNPRRTLVRTAHMTDTILALDPNIKAFGGSGIYVEETVEEVAEKFERATL